MVNFLVLLLLIVAHADAHRSLLQPSSGKVKKERSPKSSAAGVNFNNTDAVTGQPALPSGRRSDFRKNGDTKQFLAQLGPDLTEQIAAAAGFLNQPTPEAGVAALEQLLQNSDDVVSCSAAAHLAGR
jgi:hypothetical protein